MMHRTDSLAPPARNQILLGRVSCVVQGGLRRFAHVPFPLLTATRLTPQLATIDGVTVKAKHEMYELPMDS